MFGISALEQAVSSRTRQWLVDPGSVYKLPCEGPGPFVVESQRLYASIGYEEMGAGSRPVTSASPCASSFADNNFAGASDVVWAGHHVGQRLLRQ
jgi:hypothetical protein